MIEESTRRYSLVRISQDSTEYIKTLYKWQCNEKHREYYTCRPLKDILSYDEYLTFIKNHIEKGIRFYVLVDEENHHIVYGKITMFDYNQRNRSAEFGYYIPEENRGKGIGKIMIKQFLDTLFNDNTLYLHKLYATTASGNEPSIKILEWLSFNLDGRLREHYWVEGYIQDQLHYSILRKEWT